MLSSNLVLVLVLGLAALGLGVECDVYDELPTTSVVATGRPLTFGVSRNGSIHFGSDGELLIRLFVDGGTGTLESEIIAGNGLAESSSTNGFNSDPTAMRVSAIKVFPRTGGDLNIVYVVSRTRLLTLEGGVATEEIEFTSPSGFNKLIQASLKVDASRIFGYSNSGPLANKIGVLEVGSGDVEEVIGTGIDIETTPGLPGLATDITGTLKGLAVQPGTDTLYFCESRTVHRLAEDPGSVVELVLELDIDETATTLSFNDEGDVLFVLVVDAGDGKLLAVNVTDATVAEVVNDASAATWAEFFPRTGSDDGDEGSFALANTLNGEVGLCNFSFSELDFEPIQFSSPTEFPTDAPSDSRRPTSAPTPTDDTAANTNLIIAVAGTAGGCAVLALLVVLVRRRRSSNENSKIVDAIALSVAQVDIDADMGDASVTAVAIVNDGDADDAEDDVPIALASVPQLHSDAKFT